MVARHADIWHGGGDAETIRRKVGLIDEYARGYGRNPDDIAKSTSVSIWVGGEVPDSALAEISRLNGRPVDQLRAGMLQGDPATIEARLRELADLGISYFIVSGGSPALTENWRRISEEIIPRFAGG